MFFSSVQLFFGGDILFLVWASGWVSVPSFWLCWWLPFLARAWHHLVQIQALSFRWALEYRPVSSCVLAISHLECFWMSQLILNYCGGKRKKDFCAKCKIFFSWLLRDTVPPFCVCIHYLSLPSVFLCSLSWYCLLQTGACWVKDGLFLVWFTTFLFAGVWSSCRQQHPYCIWISLSLNGPQEKYSTVGTKIMFYF